MDVYTKNSVDDRHILTRAIHQHDRQAQERLYIDYRSVLRSYLLEIGNFNEQVDDLIDEVFIQICSGKGQYSGKTTVRHYLCGIAKNVARRYFSDRQKQISVASICHSREISFLDKYIPVSKSTPERLVCIEETAGLLEKAVSNLTEKRRQALELVFVHKLRPSQAAFYTGCSFGSFRKRFYTAIKILRQKLDTDSF